MLDWNDLRFVLALERGGSLKAAARDLAVDKATVGRRIGALETAVGVRLLHRKADGYALTEKGTVAVEAARKMNEVVGALTAKLAGREGPRATVRVTAPLWFTSGALIPALFALSRAHPELDVAFVATTAVVNLAERQADVAIRNVVPDQMSMTARKAGELGSTMYAAKSYAREHGLPATREEVFRHPLLGYERRLTFLPQLKWLDESPDEARVAVRVTDTLALAGAVEAGLGLAVLPCFVGDAAERLVRVPFVGVHREKIWIVTPTEMKGAPGVRAVFDFVLERFRHHADELRGA